MNETATQNLTLIDRNELRLSGVTLATSATESAVNIETTMGGMSIKGKKLHVEKLDVQSGEFVLTGNVCEIKYSPEKKSLLKRIFK